MTTVFSCATLDHQQIYKLMTGAVVPRPIAWVTSVSPDGVVNLAPFSQFTIVSFRPPMVGISIGTHEGRPKDTRANAESAGEFVVSIPSFSMMREVHLTSTAFPPNVDEAERIGVPLVPSVSVAVPGVAGALVRLECRWHSTTVFGEGGSGFVVGEVLTVVVDDTVSDGAKIDSVGLDPLARIAGPRYARLTDVTTMPPVP